MKAANCPFCDTENIALTLEPTTDWYRVRSRTLMTIGGISLCAGLGPIVAPYIIAFPHEHFRTVAELPEKLLSNLFDALDLCLNSGFFESRSLCVFEHGGGTGSGITACVEHCHLHIVDGSCDLRRDLVRHFPQSCRVGISETAKSEFAPGYLLAGHYDGKRIIQGLKAEMPNCGSQFFRRLLADKVGSAVWNWRTHPNPEVVLQLRQRWQDTHPYHLTPMR